MSLKKYVDASELKVFRKCIRRWGFSSRRVMHLRGPVSQNLVLGSAFHECLHELYSCQLPDLNKYQETLESTNFGILHNMITRYQEQVIPNDLARYEVLAIELRFPLTMSKDRELFQNLFVFFKKEYQQIYLDFTSSDEPEDVALATADEALLALQPPVCGSIDMILCDKKSKEVYGCEHKSVKNFRNDIYNLLDEQLMLYDFILQNLFVNYDGIFLNEVKKLKTKLNQKRQKYRYTQGELELFMQGVYEDIERIEKAAKGDVFYAQPGFMDCQMCDYTDLCLAVKETGKVKEVDPELYETLGFTRRTVDHLDESKTVSGKDVKLTL